MKQAANLPRPAGSVRATSDRAAFARFAWALLAYNVAVILWGAYVRATGSGAGCGRHWPLCDGQVIPRFPAVQRIVEFSHRASSGVVVILAVGTIVWAWRAFPRGHCVRLGAVLVGLFTATEALLGAALVLFGWTAQNALAPSTAAHLVNTFLLLAALALTAHWAAGGRPLQLHEQGWATWALALALLAGLALGVSGAITALGDTLFPAGSLATGVQQDFSAGANILIRLRVLHPIFAVATAAYLFVVARLLLAVRPRAGAQRLTTVLSAVLAVQLIAGAVNVALLAPIWLQIVHLLLADLTWITLVLLAAIFLAEPAAAAQIIQFPASAPHWRHE